MTHGPFHYTMPKFTQLVPCCEHCQQFIHPKFKVPDNLSHFSRHDLAYFEARSSILLYMSHDSMKFGFLVSGRHGSLYRVSILGVIPQLGSRSKSRSAKFLSLTLTLSFVGMANQEFHFYGPKDLSLFCCIYTFFNSSLFTMYVYV